MTAYHDAVRMKSLAKGEGHEAGVVRRIFFGLLEASEWVLISAEAKAWLQASPTQQTARRATCPCRGEVDAGSECDRRKLLRRRRTSRTARTSSLLLDGPLERSPARHDREHAPFKAPVASRTPPTPAAAPRAIQLDANLLGLGHDVDSACTGK